MTKEARNWFAVLLVLVLAVAGCASGGSGDAGTASADEMEVPAVPAVDLDEVGANGLLTPTAIIGRFVEAVGGEDALRSHTSMTIKGVFGISAMGMEGDMVVYAEAPDKLVMNIEMAGMGTMNQGFNGEIGWSDNPMTGPALLEGGLLDQMKEQASFYAALEYENLYPTRETVELTDFNGTSAYKVRLVNAAGRESFQFFAEDSALLIGTNGVQESEMGEAEVTVRMSDYAEFDGVLTAKSVVIETMGMELSQVTKEILWDEVPEGAFEAPASIQALLE